MSEQEQNTDEKKSEHLHTVRHEEVKAIGAGIFRTQTGKVYIAPSRAFKTKEQKEDPAKENEFSYATTIFPDQVDAWCEVAQQAKAWIEANGHQSAQEN